MAYYAFLDENNVVTEVIAGKDETELIEGLEPEIWYGNYRGQKCVRTSYNNNIRKQYAGIGMSYDPDADVFVRAKPFESWVLDENYDWQPPIARPQDGKFYSWNETIVNWEEVPNPLESWVLNESTGQLEPPVAYPTDGKDYQWSETTTNWIEVPTE